jgi:predicted nuclease of predicted toxin-antitoxin system
VKFLVDRCAGRRLAEWLRAQGHDVLEAASLGADPGDRALLQLAAQEQRVLVTIDTDFGALVFGASAPHCGLIRLPDVPAVRRIEMLRDVLARHLADVQTGAVVTVQRDKIRISRT